MKKEKDFPWKYGLFMATYYLANAVYQGYASKYFEHAGMSHVQMSILLAASPVISIIMQPVWGMLGDRMKSRNVVLRLLIAVAAMLVLTYRISGAFWYLLVMSTLFSGFYTAIQPMGDSIILEALQPKNQPFGPLRLMGCVTFAVANLAIGYLIEGRMNLVLYLTTGALALVFLSTRALPPTAGHQSSGEKMNMLALLRQKYMPGLLMTLLLLQLTMGYFYSFYSVHFTSLPGGTTTLLGLCYFISACSEIPFLLNADRLFDRFGVGKMLCVSALAMTTRWTLLACFPNIYVAMGSQVLHGWGFIVMTVCMSKYVSATVPDELKASGQMMLSVVGFGIARVFGILGGGLLSECLGGIQNGFALMAAVSGAALIFAVPRYLRLPALNGRDHGE